MKKFTRLVAFFTFIIISTVDAKAQNQPKDRPLPTESYTIDKLIDLNIHGLVLKVRGTGCVLLSYTSTSATDHKREYWDVPDGSAHYIPLKADNTDLVLATLTAGKELEITHLRPAVVAAESDKAPLRVNGNCEEIRKLFPAGL